MDNLQRKKSGEKAFLITLVSIFTVALLVLVVVGAVTAGRKAGELVRERQEAREALRLEENSSRSGESYARLSVTPVAEDIEYGGVLDLSPVVREVMPSIVAITSTISANGDNGSNIPFWDIFGGGYDDFYPEYEGSGSGIIFEMNENNLMIVTNNHVVENAKSIQITFADKSLAPAVVKGMDAAMDLAVLSVDLSELSKETKAEIKAAKLGDSDKMEVGQMALAIGNALGYGQSLTVGYISAKERLVNVDGRIMKLLQTDAAINPGNSGGALINIDGEVIGINSAKSSSWDVEGIGYAIPITSALPVLEQLKTKELLPEEQRGYLGISCKDVSEEMNSMYHMPLGVYVSDVTPDSPAEKSGIQVGDVVVGVDDVKVENYDQLRGYLDYVKVGKTVAVSIMRYQNGEYEEINLKIRLAAKPEQ